MGVPSVSGGMRPRALPPDPGPAERQLIQLLERDEAEAFELLYEQHRVPLIRFCQALLGSPEEAEDAVQQTFMSAYRALGRGVRPRLPKAWLYSIARNRCLTILRARRGPAGRLAVLPADPVEELELRETLHEAVGDLAELPDVQRTALVLSGVSDLSHDEVAQLIGCDREQVKSLVFTARTALREARDARQMPCETIREELSTLRGGSLRRGLLRRHLRACPSCAEFRKQLKVERARVAAIAPIAPWLALKKLAHQAAVHVGSGWGVATKAPLLGSWASAKLSLLALAVGVGGGGIIVADRPSPVGMDTLPSPARLAERAPPLVPPAALPSAEAPRLVPLPAVRGHAPDRAEAEPPAVKPRRGPEDATKGSTAGTAAHPPEARKDATEDQAEDTAARPPRAARSRGEPPGNAATRSRGASWAPGAAGRGGPPQQSSGFARKPPRPAEPPGAAPKSPPAPPAPPSAGGLPSGTAAPGPPTQPEPPGPRRGRRPYPEAGRPPPVPAGNPGR